MQCSRCNTLVFAFEKSSSQLYITMPEHVTEKALKCHDCEQIFCGTCASKNLRELDGGGGVAVCTECGGLLGPYET